jgi:adenylosuccinate synthase
VGGLTPWLIITKLDVLDGLDELKICKAYDLDGRRIECVPARADELERCRPVYETLAGWNTQVRQARDWDELPGRAQDYLSRLSDLAGVPLSLVSVGSGREDTVCCP